MCVISSTGQCYSIQWVAVTASSVSHTCLITDGTVMQRVNVGHPVKQAASLAITLTYRFPRTFRYLSPFQEIQSLRHRTRIALEYQNEHTWALLFQSLYRGTFIILYYDQQMHTYFKNFKNYHQQLHLKYLCNLSRYGLQAPWGWHDSVETCRSLIICEIIVHLLVIVQNKKNTWIRFMFG